MKLVVFKNPHGVVGLKYTDDKNRLLAGPVYFDKLAIDKKLVSELVTCKKNTDNMTYTKPKRVIQSVQAVAAGWGRPGAVAIIRVLILLAAVLGILRMESRGIFLIEKRQVMRSMWK